MTNDDLFVLDTSVAVGWFFLDEPHREQCLGVRDAVRERPESFIVPSLFYSEFVHVLARKSACNEAFINEALRLILRLGLRVLLPSQSAMVRLVHWSCRGLSGYDATFLALAEDVHGLWLTADEKAIRSAHGKNCRALREWPARAV